MRKFNQLSRREQVRVHRNLKAAFSAAGYDIVSGPDQMLRRRGQIEFGGEDSALPYYNRMRMLNMARQGVRNGDSMRALLKQFELNVVGSVGGKATFSFGKDNRKTAEDVREKFAAWAEHCEFADDLSLSKTLQLIVDTKFTGGDLVLLFDDNLIEDSGRILTFEPDEIADVPKDWFVSKFPAGYTQRQGRIYNQNGRFVGVTVSHKYRGTNMFKRDPEGVFFLTVDRTKALQDWVMLREVWRFNQGRGVPPVAAPLDSLLDLEAVTKFEVQSAMKNAQTLGQIISTKGEKEADADGEADDLDPQLAAQAAARANGQESQPEDADDDISDDSGKDEGVVDDDIELENIKGSGTIFDLLPDGYKMELLDTRRPNPNVEGFVKWLSGRSGAAVGLARFYATMEANASYSGARAEMIASWNTFYDWQKNLERDACDWIVRRWVAWASRKGELDVSKFPVGWERKISWSWPVMKEIDAKADAEAKKVQLENGLITLDELHPGDPDGFMEKIAEDVKRYHVIGLVHPMEKSVSGGVLPSGDPANPSKSQSEKEKDKNERENNGEV